MCDATGREAANGDANFCSSIILVLGQSKFMFILITYIIPGHNYGCKLCY
jgi:hypothetical protein